jgi:ankyrin repeat protein
VELLLAKGAEVDARNKDGKTPAQMAAAGGHPDIVKLLLAAGANAKAK